MLILEEMAESLPSVRKKIGVVLERVPCHRPEAAATPIRNGDSGNPSAIGARETRRRPKTRKASLRGIGLRPAEGDRVCHAHPPVGGPS
jgi:hypothetical protein